MSFANKFLGTGEQNVSNGTLDLYGLKLGAKNLAGTGIDTVKVDGAGNLYSSAITAGDVSGTVANPLLADLDANQKNITNASSLEVTNGVNSITMNFAGTTNDVLDLSVIGDIDEATQNINASTTAGQTDFDGDVTVQGDLQVGGALIGSLTINDVNTGGVQTNDLNVSVTNLPAVQNVKTDTLDRVAVTIDSSEVTGNIPTTVANFPLVQGISGSVAVTNFPGVQSVSVTNFPNPQIVTANAGTNLNTSALALETGGNLADINSKQSAIVNSTSLTATATGSTATTNTSIDGKIPTKGQKAASGSLPAVLSADYASTAFVATDSGNFVTVALDQGLVAGTIPVDLVDKNTGLQFASGVGPATTATLRTYSATNTDKHYVKGYATNIGTAGYETIGTFAAWKTIALPLANTQIQLSSSGADTGTVVVYGYNSANTPVSAAYVLNGTTPVTNATQFFRITRAIYSAGTNNAGTIFATPNGTVLVGGAPSTAADLLWMIQAGDNVSQICQGYVPYKSGKSLHPKRVIYSCANGANGEILVSFEMKATTSAIWYREFFFYIGLNSNSQFGFDLSGIAPIPFQGTAGYDVRIRVVRTGSGTSYLSAALSLELI